MRGDSRRTTFCGVGVKSAGSAELGEQMPAPLRDRQAASGGIAPRGRASELLSGLALLAAGVPAAGDLDRPAQIAQHAPSLPHGIDVPPKHPRDRLVRGGEPAAGATVDPAVAGAGTFVGALCFLVAALLPLPGARS